MRNVGLSALIGICILFFVSFAPAANEPLTIYTAKSVITMNPSQPRATAVAVTEGRIVAVGSLETLQSWMDARSHIIDNRFADKIIMPGLIDNHLHPFLAAIVLNTEWITPQPWNLLGRETAPVRTEGAYKAALSNAVDSMPAGDGPFITWGYHELWHGKVRRVDLDAISSTRPIIIMQRSFHEIVANTAGLRWMGFDPGEEADHQDVDLKTGFFSEMGLDLALGRMVPYFFEPTRLTRGLNQLRAFVHYGGITTIGDMGVGGYLGLEKEAGLYNQMFGNEQTPFRMLLVPAPGLMANPPTIQDVDIFSGASTQQIRVGRHVKFLADGGFFAQNMRMNFPGYTDGHEGKWMTEPSKLYEAIKPYWNSGYQVHVHVNGDEGMDAVLNILARLLDEKPRFDHRFTLHHVGFATNEQITRAARLGVLISAQPNYLWALGDMYARHGMGTDRAAQMSRLGAMVRAGIPTSLHSDFTMAPAAPLTLAWIAANRITAEGTLMAPEERLSVHQALKAVTIDAAFAMQMEDEVGSIAAGKRADFTVLEQDPFVMPASNLKEIAIWGTVFEGRIYPLQGQK
ncbi:amidohydrolase [Kordiimonas aquimaris]|uniref:amidohydrolase n=1 Tax=Kordiimonas aquimaris TaxID=707591 RepID=UPI0021D21356|nr:amidohydrolase [Kordiimonas aquimaris]